MARIAANFLRNGQPAIASYDFFDLSSSIGYKELALAKASDGSGVLLPKEAASDVWYTERSSAGTTSVDFDYTFKSAMSLGGNAICVIPTLIAANGSAGTNTCHVVVTLKKVSTATTTLATVTSNDLSFGFGQNESRYNMMSLAIAQTNFGNGDILRLSVDFVVSSIDNGGNTRLAMGHSPLGTIGVDAGGISFVTSASNGGVTTKAVLQLPFRVDL